MIVSTVALCNMITKERVSEMSKYDEACALAYKAGHEDGTAAASWYFDGNTDPDTYRKVLVGIDEGDPVVMDSLPYPDLSGQWADQMTDGDLLMAIADQVGPIHEDERDGIVSAYEDAYVTAAHAEIERVARYQLSDAGSVMIAYALLLVMPVVFLATLAASALSVVS